MYTIKQYIGETPYIPSEGEEFLMDFFRSEGIKFQSQIEINNLKGDNHSYRVADFYLPKYKVFVEFLGMWNTFTDKKNEYKEKKILYEKNNVPCIYFYPENLGIVHYIFNKRLRSELKKYNLKTELNRYNLKLLFENKVDAFILLLLMLILLVWYLINRDPEFNWQAFLLVGLISIYQVYRIIKGYKKFFSKEYSYVNFARE